MLKKLMIIEIPCNAEAQVAPEVSAAVGRITGIVNNEFLALGITPVRITFKTEVVDGR
jgi:hypothetical protein